MIDCSELIIPLINELFNEDYTGKEQIVFSPNESFIKQQDGKEEKRITDSSFKIVSEYGEQRYLCECQSNADSSMLIRILEYTIQIALHHGIIIDNTLKVSIPKSAILFLRSNASTPNQMHIEIETPNGTVTFNVNVMKTQDYTIEELFEKKLLFLIPFYIFVYEKHLKEYDRDEEKLWDLQAEFHKIADQMEDMEMTGELSVYIRKTITEMTHKVVEKIARKYKNVREGVKVAMGGHVLEHEAKTIYNTGYERGEERGIEKGKLESAKALLDVLDDEIIAEKLGIPIDVVKALRN